MMVNDALDIINEEISLYKGNKGPGRWRAGTYDVGFGKQPALIYEYQTNNVEGAPLPGEEWEDIDDPLVKWGGLEIIEKLKAYGLHPGENVTSNDGTTHLDITVFYHIEE